MPRDTNGEASQEIQSLADRLYDGRGDRAFVHWILGCILADLELTEEQLIAHSALDGAGDLGIDGFFIDSTNNRLVFVQGKYQDSVGRGSVLEFREAIESLLDEGYVSRHGNAALREVYPDLFEALIDEDYAAYAVVGSAGRIARAGSAYASGAGSRPWVFEFGGETRRKDILLQVLDLERLLTVRQTLIAAGIPSPTVDLPVASVNSAVCVHKMAGEFTAMQATVPAQAIAEAYRRFRSGIFRHNPRGPQGSNKVNRQIQDTLHDSELKGNFHILNNGLTIVCDSVTFDPESQILHIEDFQIVNGCQTAYTLYSLRDLVTDDVMVGVRVIEGETWAPMIARSTNSQTAVRPEQLASLGREHDRLKERFDSLSAPWYYEKQLGARRFLTPMERQIHRARYGNRVVNVKEVGQFATAFMGNPIMAKYDLKAVFEQSEATGRDLYNRIFRADNNPEQLLLPVLIGRRVEVVVRDRLRELDATLEQQEEDESKRITEAEWLPYARTHLVGLIGELLRSQAAGEVGAGKLLSAAESRQRMATLEDWFSDVFGTCLSAVEWWVEQEWSGGRLSNMREFFRSPRLYSRMGERAKRR